MYRGRCRRRRPICLAVTRGFALDLLATGDVDVVDAAAERFRSGLEQHWAATGP